MFLMTSGEKFPCICIGGSGLVNLSDAQWNLCVGWFMIPMKISNFLFSNIESIITRHHSLVRNKYLWFVCLLLLLFLFFFSRVCVIQIMN